MYKPRRFFYVKVRVLIGGKTSPSDLPRNLWVDKHKAFLTSEFPESFLDKEISLLLPAEQVNALLKAGA